MTGCAAPRHDGQDEWVTTRQELAKALANIELRPPASGPMAHKIVAEDMADAILAQLRPHKHGFYVGTHPNPHGGTIGAQQ